jgi:hypothetical protein
MWQPHSGIGRSEFFAGMESVIGRKCAQVSLRDA